MLTASLGAAIAVVGSIVLFVQVRAGRFFTVLTFATGLFLLEGVGGAIKALLPGIFPDFAATTWDNPLRFVPQALGIYLLAYLLFLCGYAFAHMIGSPRNTDRAAVADRYFDHNWTGSFKVFLGVVTLLALGLGFVQHYSRIRQAGGWSAFLETAYTHRFGSGTETSEGSAFVGATNLVAGTAVALVALWVMAWARHRLRTGGKIFVVVIVLLLLFRAWTSLFRGTFIFSALAIVAAIGSELKLSKRRVATIGALMLALLLLTNFVHYYLYSVTAGWERQSFLESQSHLIAPHMHVWTLSAIAAMESTGAPHLHGFGILESVLFFVPRIVWHSKLPSDAYGTMAVQSWAGLSTTDLQIAVTQPGELIAHFGYPALALIMFFGGLYGLIDRLRDSTPDLRAALYGMILPRVLADFGMGISAMAITVVSLNIFLAEIFGAWVLSRFVTAVFRGVRRRTVARTVQPLGSGSTG